MAELEYKPVVHDHGEFVAKAMKRRGFKAVYEGLREEYELARKLIAARTEAGLTQEKVALLMGTTKSAVSRLESGGSHVPTLSTLKKYAEAVGCRVELNLVRTRARAASRR